MTPHTMSRPFPQVAEASYKSHVPMYYHGNFQQPGAQFPVMNYHYNPELSYPQVPSAQVGWPAYPRHRPGQKEDMVSPLANTMKFSYPAQTPAPGYPFQYSAVPYVMQGSAPNMQVPRTAEPPRGLNSSPEKRTLPVPSLLEPSAAHATSSEAGSPSETSSRRSSGDTYARKLVKSASFASTSGNSCGVCGKVFQKPYNLKSHMKTHSTERPYKCSFCPKDFARSHDRKRHENLHGGQKNFKCEGYLRNGVTKWGCGKKFARSDALSRHFRTETGYLCIKQFMEEEKERDTSSDGKPEVVFPHEQMQAMHPYYAGQQLPQHYPMNTSARPYEPLTYATSQISLPPLLRH